MKNIIKVIILFVFIVAFIMPATSLSAKAAKEEVSKIYHFNAEHKKFPMKLSSGLTIGKHNVGDEYIPLVYKGKATTNSYYWCASSGGQIQFTITKHNSTFISCMDGANSGVSLSGISPNGTDFLDEYINNEPSKIKADFLSPTVIEIEIEELGRNYTSKSSDHIGNYNSTFFQLSGDGKKKELDYIDKDFADLAKKGRLKWVPGSIGMNDKGLSDRTKGEFEFIEVPLYDATKAQYYFNADFSKGKVHAISKKSLIIGTESNLTKKMKKYFGDPIKKTNSGNNYAYIYKAGEYYVSIIGKNKTAKVQIGTKEGIDTAILYAEMMLK
ncbi:hypothetical protein [Bacillus ndiopicus]|uniref:hypothetical protein n=1 Tax=Bacillus ndiopicus TaxID=1347368 RepID=UPI0005A823DA|nr:hypothetical protein [Bacillus ndiopicus]